MPFEKAWPEFTSFMRTSERKQAACRTRVGLTARLDPEAKIGTPNLTTGQHGEKAQRHGGGAMLEE